MDDRRIGAALRALRRRRGLRQIDVAEAAGVGQTTVSRAERGHVDTLSNAALRRIAAALDAELVLELRWRGGALDRLLDERHALLGAIVVDTLRTAGWQVIPEVTYSRYGERGSIDLLAAHHGTHSIAVCELKSEITSYEEMQRRFDSKRRLTQVISMERFGWRPTAVGALLVVLDTTANRTRLERISSLVAASYPERSLDIRRWLRTPAGPLAGLWFVRLSHHRAGKCRRPGPDRIRRPTTSSAEHGLDRETAVGLQHHSELPEIQHLPARR